MNRKPVSKKASQNKCNDGERRELTPYHNAAFDVFAYRLRKYRDNGDITLTDECQLSRGPMKIDIVIVKKNRAIELEPSWAKIFREHNLIEYKSPVDRAPGLSTFDKLTGYARLYASQKSLKLTAVTATLVCAREPKKLLTALEKEYGYEILRNGDGIYYIIQKGGDPERNLAIQIVVEWSDVMLAAVDKKPQGAEISDKIAEFIITEGLKEQERLTYWFKALPTEHLNNVTERIENMDKKRLEAWMNLMKKTGLYDRANREGQEEGLQKGRREVFCLLEKGYTPAEAKKKLQMT